MQKFAIYLGASLLLALFASAELHPVVNWTFRALFIMTAVMFTWHLVQFLRKAPVEKE